MRVALKEPDYAYISNFLWLPTWSVTREELDAKLRFVVEGYKGRSVTVHVLWHKCGDHYRVPRHFPIPKGVQVVDLRPRAFQPLNIDDRVTKFQDDRQRAAWESFSAATGGVLKLGCGGGKTVLGLKKIVQNNGPAVVIFYDTGLMAQWEVELRKFTSYTGPIGYIQGNRCDWDRPIVFASTRTLIKRPKLPVQARTRFKTVIFDEAHHCPAALLKASLGMFWGERYALTATPERADFTENILYLHVGPVFHEDTTQPLTPRIYFRRSPIRVSLNSPRVQTRGWGELSIPKLISFLASSQERNRIIVEEVLKAREHNRKVLVITNTLEHVALLHRMIPDSKPLTGKTPQDQRHIIFKRYPVVIAIKQVGQEGLDAKDMDTVIFAFPVKRKENFDQIAGRCMRVSDGKKVPVIVVIDDVEIPPMYHICRALQADLSLRGVRFELV